MATGLRMEAAIFQIVAIFPDFQIVGRAWLHKIARLWLDNGWVGDKPSVQLWAAHYYFYYSAFCIPLIHLNYYFQLQPHNNHSVYYLLQVYFKKHFWD